MTGKRFEWCGDGIIDVLEDEFYPRTELGFQRICNLLNQSFEMRIHWKKSCLREFHENNILWEEIANLKEQGVELSVSFQEYLDSMSSEYEKFWRRKLKYAREQKVIE